KRGVITKKKVSWIIYLRQSDRIECDLDDSAFYRRAVINGKQGPTTKVAHKAGDGNAIRIQITVAADHVTHRIGDMEDTFPCKVTGRTGFTSKIGLKLVR